MQEKQNNLIQIWDRYVKPIINKLFPYEYSKFKPDFLSCKESSEIAQIRLRREVVQPFLNGLGYGNEDEFFVTIYIPLLHGQKEAKLRSIFLRLFLEVKNRGLVAAFVEWVGDWFEAPTLDDMDEQIRKLAFNVENDSEISIGERGKQRKVYNCKAMGFKNERTNEWKLLKKVLDDPRHVIELPKSRKPDGTRTKEYDRELKVLERLNEKLRTFLNNTFNLRLPPGYKLYRPYTPLAPRAYYFIFKEPLGGYQRKYEKYEQMPVDEILKELEELVEQNPNQGNWDDTVFDKVSAMSRAAEAKGASEEQIKEILDKVTIETDSVNKIFQESQEYYQIK